MSSSLPVPEIEDGKSILKDAIHETTTATSQACLSPAVAIRASGKEPTGDAYLTTNVIDGRPSLDTLSDISIPAVTNNGRSLAGQSSFAPSRDSRRMSRSSSRLERLKQHLEAFWVQNRGLALVMLSQFFGAVMNGATRVLETEREDGKGMHPFQILFARMSVTVVLSTLYMWRMKVPHFPFGAREVRWLLVLRGLTGFFGVYGIYYSLLYLPLAEATVLTFLAPIVSCIACSFLIHEPFTRKQQIAALISLFGVVLIARPTALFSSSTSSQPTSPGFAAGSPDALSPSNITTPSAPFTPPEPTPTQRLTAVLVGLLGVLGAGGAYTTIRWIGPRAHPLISVNYFAIWCTIVSTVSLVFIPGISFLLPRGIKEWTLLTLLGICGFLMQFLLTTGLSSDPSSRATNMVYTQMLFALAIDKAVFGTTPGVLSIFGSSLILGSAIYIALHKEVAKKNQIKGDEERGLVSAEGRANDEDSDDEGEGEEESREDDGARRERQSEVDAHTHDDDDDDENEIRLQPLRL